MASIIDPQLLASPWMLPAFVQQLLRTQAGGAPTEAPGSPSPSLGSDFTNPWMGLQTGVGQPNGLAAAVPGVQEPAAKASPGMDFSMFAPRNTSPQELADAAISLKQAGRARPAPQNDNMFGRGTDWNGFFGNRDVAGKPMFTGGFQPVDPAARAATINQQQRAGVFQAPGRVLPESPDLSGSQRWNSPPGSLQGGQGMINPQAKNPWADDNFFTVQPGMQAKPAGPRPFGTPTIIDERGVQAVSPAPTKMNPGLFNPLMFPAFTAQLLRGA